ncbi:MAG: pilus assembly protein [Gammaproteobacteria bacterium]|nr:pilus assembly protein [Gammaproteobacteria bacterium]NNF59870.1 pilus assembly protein [Gammaproteobacteria bacterium]NNM21489.1 pilus assembly protein [Gammaproteobacteria bacterium]
MTTIRQYTGTTTVEFAIVGALFFMVLLGVVEFGRALYTWNTLSEVARRGARVAAVCPLNHSAIGSVALISEPGESQSPFVHGLTTEHILIQYLNENGEIVADPTGNYSDIRFVRVSINGFRYTTLIPFFSADRIFSTPGFAATLPRESLGVPREGEDAVCFGSQS